MSRPSILFVTRYHLLTCVGGAEEQGWLFSTEFARRGWDVHYASQLHRQYDQQVVDGVTQHALPENPPRWSGNRVALRRVLHELRPTVVYNIMFNSYAGHSVQEAPRGTFRVFACAAEGDGFIWSKLRQFSQDMRPVVFLRRFPFLFHELWLAKRGAFGADLVIAQRIEQFEAFRRAGIPCELIRNVQAAVPLAETQSHEGRPLVLWAAALKDWKRPVKFIELARGCADLDADFVMIGAIQDPKYPNIVASAVKELGNFHYDGVIPLTEVGQYFRRAHLLVNTSVTEGYPTTFVQAWQRGIPTASLGVNPDRLLTDRGFGVAANSMEELIREVRKLLLDPVQRRDMGRRAQEFARQEYDLVHAVDRLEKIFADRGVTLP